jgi:hypothetical protein
VWKVSGLGLKFERVRCMACALYVRRPIQTTNTGGHPAHLNNPELVLRPTHEVSVAPRLSSKGNHHCMPPLPLAERADAAVEPPVLCFLPDLLILLPLLLVLLLPPPLLPPPLPVSALAIASKETPCANLASPEGTGLPSGSFASGRGPFVAGGIANRGWRAPTGTAPGRAGVAKGPPDMCRFLIRTQNSASTRARYARFTVCKQMPRTCICLPFRLTNLPGSAISSPSSPRNSLGFATKCRKGEGRCCQYSVFA